MDKFNPSEWTNTYVRRHEKHCVKVLEMLTSAMQNAIRSSEYLAAAQCCDKICEGLALMCAEISADKYEPMFYSYSYILAQIVIFGVGGEQGMRAAVPALEDAFEHASKCAQHGRRTADRAKRDKDLIGDILYAVRSGQSAVEIKKQFCSDFPNNLIG